MWFLRAPRWYIGPTAMPRAAVTPIAPERSEGAIGCDSRPRHCKRDDIPAWRPNKITLLALLPLDLIMYYHFISFLRAVQSRVGHSFNPIYVLFVSHDCVGGSSLACARTWERTPPNNGHHVIRSSNQREAFLIAPATTAMPISP